MWFEVVRETQKKRGSGIETVQFLASISKTVQFFPLTLDSVTFFPTLSLLLQPPLRMSFRIEDTEHRYVFARRSLRIMNTKSRVVNVVFDWFPSKGERMLFCVKWDGLENHRSDLLTYAELRNCRGGLAALHEHWGLPMLDRMD
jgi:hypothetical protein